MADLRAVHQRLHALEGIAGKFVDAQKSARAKEDRQYKRLTHAIAFLAVVVAVAAIVVPLVVSHLIGQ